MKSDLFFIQTLELAETIARDINSDNIQFLREKETKTAIAFEDKSGKRFCIWSKHGVVTDNYRWLFGNLLKRAYKNINPGTLCIVANKMANMTLQHSVSLINKHVKTPLQKLEEHDFVKICSCEEIEEIS